MMFDLLRPVASANLTTDFRGSEHASMSLLASSFSSHLTRLFFTAGILITGAFSSHFQSRSAARRIALIIARCVAFVCVLTDLGI
ncbi:hypothetical protein BW91_21200 [Escherichia coli O91:H14 str. 06-3691]|nr:hypothetical protein BY10_14635 [Escherichia coli O104:H4 str. 2011EL-1675A]EYY49685.1 hypothetical protein BX81_22580 [Escherichia coli O165:H25 str. 2010C-4874]EYZ40345.1 hypothetical protein BW91_21200 [Escherichia coli O91:H14 str. 06-3691]EZA28445.1 hypothetical protein BW70_27120 [Escherichia coli O174:H8 str. 04-3038]EZD96484.1 hypothetical protein BX07_20350 [Escherichia coli O91:H14 str. 2009C-3227]